MRFPNARDLRKIAGIAALCGLVGVGAARLWGARPDEAFVLGLVALAGSGLVYGRLSIADNEGASGKAQACGEAKERAELDRKIEAALAQVVELVRLQAADNAEFGHRLGGASQRLAQHAHGSPLSEIVMALIEDNRAMQGRLDSLSVQLNESRSRIQELQSDLVRAEEAGVRDMVTAVGNRRFFEAALAEEIVKARGEGYELCLALADIDNFKRVNDAFGHPVGDWVLKRFADLIVRNVKGRDKVARYGGEEFAIIFPNTRLEDAAVVVDQIRKSLESKKWMVASSGRRVGTVTASFGVARLCGTDDGPELVARADARLYEAKAAGRNRVVVDAASASPEAEPRRALAAG